MCACDELPPEGATEAGPKPKLSSRLSLLERELRLEPEDDEVAA